MQLPNLKKLLLHGNKMQPVTTDLISQLPRQQRLFIFLHLILITVKIVICYFRSLNSLRVLALNNCGLSSWSEVQLLEQLLPVVEELYLSDNAISSDLPRRREEAARLAAIGALPEAPSDNNNSSSSSPSMAPLPPSCDSTSTTSSSMIGSTVRGFEHLTLLDLTRCGLDEWSQVLFFSRLPSLLALILDGNPLSEIEPVSATEAAEGSGSFQNLQRISLSSTQ